MLRTILALSLLFAWNAHSSETFSGTAFRIFVDWEKPTRAPSLYHFVRLNSSEGQKQQFLPLLGAGDEILEIPVGAELKLTGTRVGSYFLMENYQVAQKSPTFNDVCPSKLGAQKTATLTVGGSSSRLPSGFQTKRVEETFFGEGDQSLNNYLKKTTFEKSWIEGHHYTSTQANGVFKLEKNYPIRRSTFEEDITKLLEASIKIADPSIDYTQYGRLIHIIPKLPSGVLGVGTLDCIADVETEDGKVDLSVFWAPYFVFRSAINNAKLFILAHEFGHNLGFGHSSTIDYRSSKSIGKNGEAPRGHEEYGDPFSIMGNFPRISLYPLKHQLAAGWIKPSQVKEVEESGTYRIVPMETNDDSQLKGLKVKRMTEGAEKPAYLWIEYHQDLGEFHSRPTGSITIRYEDAYLNEKWGDVYTFLPEYFKSNRLRFWEDAFSDLSIEVKAAKRDFADIKVNL